MKYRKKPVEVEVMYFDPNKAGSTSVGEIVAWIESNGGEAGHYGNEIAITTLEGTMTAKPGDYIIRGVAGEFYPCKPDIFAQTYEAV